MTYDEYAKLRDSLGLTDYKVAKDTGIGRSTFSDWKSGRSAPKEPKIKAITEYLMSVKQGKVSREIPQIGGMLSGLGRIKHIDSYFQNEKSAEYADLLKSNPDYQVLFDAVSKVKPEDIEKVAQMIKLMSGE